MENRYLCKAKRTDNGEWVEGYYAYMRPHHYIMPKGSWDCWCRIDGKTLCQCTGLKDKNGKLIWENNIVKDKNGNLYKAFWQDNYYQFSWICIKSNSLPVGAKWDFYSIKSFEIEVIGNVFDNQELLEVQE